LYISNADIHAKSVVETMLQAFRGNVEWWIEQFELWNPEPEKPRRKL
jgi:hypothetical protein